MSGRRPSCNSDLRTTIEYALQARAAHVEHRQPQKAGLQSEGLAGLHSAQRERHAVV